MNRRCGDHRDWSDYPNLVENLHAGHVADYLVRPLAHSLGYHHAYPVHSLDHSPDLSLAHCPAHSPNPSLPSTLTENTTVLHLHRHGRRRRCLMTFLQVVLKRLEIALDRVKVVGILPEEIGGVMRTILLQQGLVFRAPPAQLNECERQRLAVADQRKVIVTSDEEEE